MEGNSNRQAQEEEKLALTSIYTQDILKEVKTGRNDQISYLVRFSVQLGEHLPTTTAVLTIHLPPTYPRSDPPVYELKEAYGQPAWISDAHRSVLKAELQDMFETTAIGSCSEHGVVLFEWIEWLRDWLESSWQTHLEQHPEFIARHRNEEQRISEEMASISLQRAAAALDRSGEGVEPGVKGEMLEPTNLPPVYHSQEPLVDRKSVFVAHTAPVTSVEEVERVRQHLLSNSKIARATHNILAYRIVQQRAGGGKGGHKHAIDGEVTISDCDDDGENAAGGRLLHLLEVCKCRNVMVVVSRWYGGTLLGPDRFKHINNVARELLNAHGFIP